MPFRTRRLLTFGECDFRSVTTPRQEIIATWRNRIEASFGEITDLMDLARHGAHAFLAPAYRTAATITAHISGMSYLAAAKINPHNASARPTGAAAARRTRTGPVMAPLRVS